MSPQSANTGEAPLIVWSRWVFRSTSWVVMPLVTLLVTADALLRYFASSSIPWTHDAVGISIFLLICAGLPYSYIAGFHVRMEMLYGRLSPFLKRWVNAISALAALWFGFCLAYSAATSALQSLEMGSAMPEGSIPLWPAQLAGAGLCVIFFLMMIWDLMRRVRGEDA